MLKAGIVGLPNVGTVSVPDDRLQQLAELSSSQEIVPTRVEFVDIAGLVAGASQGEGLGNKFLANIREVDAIVHVVRCFEDDDVIHVSGSVDPGRDAEVINLELAQAAPFQRLHHHSGQGFVRGRQRCDGIRWVCNHSSSFWSHV